MKLKLISIFIFSASFIMSGFCQTPAFPEAEGYGKYVTGGRGGRVIYVKHTKDDPSGSGIPGGTAGYNNSLRAALETSGSDPITIVFKCGGVIPLGGQIQCSRSNVTLAGQTAVGDGICITGYGINFSGDNIIVRHIRVRVGDRINQNNPALTFSNGKKAIFDHCSFSWSVEENVNITDVDSVTFQWCFNTESLYNSVHTKGARAYAAQWGGQHASYHHNLLAHHNNRMPRQNGNTSNDYQLTWDYRNNVHYNWGSSGAFYGGGVEQSGGFSHSNILNNYYKPGPATTTSKGSQYFCAPSIGRNGETQYGYGQWYLSGNFMYDNPDKTSNNWSGLSGGIEFYASDTFDTAPITMTTAEVAYPLVLAYAGATKPKRDFIDERIVTEVQTGTATYGGDLGAGKGIIDRHIVYMATPSTDPNTILTWEKSLYAAVTQYSTLIPTDTDTDGIPDWWETLNNLNPTDTLDGKALAGDNSGYTNLEKYLNSEDVGKNGPTKVNGVAAKPEFSVSPNPVTDNITINSVQAPKFIEIYSATGALLLKYSNSEKNNYSVTHLTKGLYYVKVTFRNGSRLTQKLLKN
jgi:hypothetical protein